MCRNVVEFRSTCDQRSRSLIKASPGLPRHEGTGAVSYWTALASGKVAAHAAIMIDIRGGGRRWHPSSFAVWTTT